MADTPPTRSVKIADDERGGWSSDRPRRGGGPVRPPDVSVRCRVLTPSDSLRYSPGSLVVVVSPGAAERERFAQDLIEERGAVFSLGKVRGLLAGRVGEEEMDERAAQLLQAAVGKRLESGESVVLVTEGRGAEEREPFVRAAHANKRPRHVVLLETSRDQVPDEDRPALNDLRRRLDAGELGAEGFQTALRLGGSSLSELKRVVFRAPSDD